MKLRFSPNTTLSFPEKLLSNLLHENIFLQFFILYLIWSTSLCYQTDKTVSTISIDLKLKLFIFQTKNRTTYIYIKYWNVLRNRALKITLRRLSHIWGEMRAFQNDFHPISHEKVRLACSWYKPSTYSDIAFSPRQPRLSVKTSGN